MSSIFISRALGQKYHLIDFVFFLFYVMLLTNNIHVLFWGESGQTWVCPYIIMWWVDVGWADTWVCPYNEKPLINQ